MRNTFFIAFIVAALGFAFFPSQGRAAWVHVEGGTVHRLQENELRTLVMVDPGHRVPLRSEGATDGEMCTWMNFSSNAQDPLTTLTEEHAQRMRQLLLAALLSGREVWMKVSDQNCRIVAVELR